MWKLVMPSAEVHQIRPPWDSTIDLVIASPRLNHMDEP